MKISAIAAMSENRIIGKNNQLPWHLPADLQHFKTITMGSPILMGRKTYESIGRPLPGRMNLIMTRNTLFEAPGCIVISSIEEAIKQANATGSQELFIIGGADIYQQLLPAIDRLYLTIVEGSFDGDAYFPQLNPKDWQETEKQTFFADTNNPHDYRFIVLDRTVA